MKLSDNYFDDWLITMGLLHGSQTCDHCGNQTLSGDRNRTWVCHERRCLHGNFYFIVFIMNPFAHFMINYRTWFFTKGNQSLIFYLISLYFSWNHTWEMHFSCLIFLIIMLNVHAKIQSLPKDKFEKLRITEKNFQYIKNLHVNWHGIAVKALMGQLGKQIYKKIPPDEKRRLATCLDQINEKYDLVLSARCLIRARNRQIIRQNKRNKFHSDLKMLPKISIDASQKWMGSFKVIQEETTQRKRRKLFRGSIQKLKIFPTQSFRFEKYRRRLKRSPYRLFDKDLRFEEYTPQFKVKKMENLEKLNSKNDVSPVTKFSNFLQQLLTIKKQKAETPTSIVTEKKWPKTYEVLKKLKHEMDRTKQLPGSKPYKFRMYDIVLENEEPTFSPSENKSPDGLIRQGLQMVNSIIGKERAGRRKKGSTKWLSPRFLPLMPDKMESENEVLSPTILSFYKNNKTIASLPDVLETFGMTEHDRDSVLGMLMDVSGATKNVDLGIDLLKEINFFDIKEDIFNSNERIVANFEKLENSLSFSQQKHLDKSGFTIMEHHQMEKFYRDQGLKNEIDLTSFECHKNYTNKQTEHALWLTIEEIAQNLTSTVRKRQKRFFLSIPEDVEFARETGGIDFARPILLAPFAFAPLFGFAILGPIIMSPMIFSPSLINPTLLSPIILSPGVAVPEVLSAYAFGPFILSPFVMQPGILTPYLLGPNILNPFVLSPLILSPYVLSPDILSPQILGGGVLSPTFLSPAVLTETYLMLSVLSPSFLS